MYKSSGLSNERTHADIGIVDDSVMIRAGVHPHTGGAATDNDNTSGTTDYRHDEEMFDNPVDGNGPGTPNPDADRNDAYMPPPVHGPEFSFTGAGIGEQIDTQNYNHVPHWVGQAIDNSDNPPPPSNLDNEGDPPEDQGEQGPANSDAHRVHFTDAGIGERIATGSDHHEPDSNSSSDSDLGAVVEAIQGGNTRAPWFGDSTQHNLGDLSPPDQGGNSHDLAVGDRVHFTGAGIGEQIATGSDHHEPYSNSTSGSGGSGESVLPAWCTGDGEPPPQDNPEGDKDADSGPQLVLPDLPHFVAGGGPGIGHLAEVASAKADAGAAHAASNDAHGGSFWDQAAAATQGVTAGAHLSASAVADVASLNLAATATSAHDFSSAHSDMSAHIEVVAHDAGLAGASLHSELGTATFHDSLALSGGSFSHQMHV